MLLTCAECARLASRCLLRSGLCLSRAVSVAGVELLQPSTALAGLALFALLYCALARLWSTRRSPLKQILDRHPLPHEEESRLQASTSCRASMLRSCLLGVTKAAASRESVRHFCTMHGDRTPFAGQQQSGWQMPHCGSDRV